MWFRRHRIGMFHKFRCKASKFRRGNRMWRNRTFCFDALDKIFGIFFIQLWSRFDFKRQGVPSFCLNDWLCLLSTNIQFDRIICQVFYRSKYSHSRLQFDRVKSGPPIDSEDAMLMTNYAGLPLLYRMAGQLEAARQVLETFFTRTANIKGLKNSPIYQEAKNLYKELSSALGVQKQSH